MIWLRGCNWCNYSKVKMKAGLHSFKNRKGLKQCGVHLGCCMFCIITQATGCPYNAFAETRLPTIKRETGYSNACKKF